MIIQLQGCMIRWWILLAGERLSPPHHQMQCATSNSTIAHLRSEENARLVSGVHMHTSYLVAIRTVRMPGCFVWLSKKANVEMFRLGPGCWESRR